jgi:hypothetical protein
MISTKIFFEEVDFRPIIDPTAYISIALGF